jgi:3-hydroxy-9,10-secoandrosta-1,3,5(10)-triene-9,17-dione monooxygenase reductase component
MDLSLHAPVQAEELRLAMRHWTAGVTVVTTTGRDGTHAGIVSNSFTSVSLEPALVSWCVDRGSSSFDAWCRAEAFSVHILGRENADLVPRFAARGTDKFAGLHTTPSTVGSPALDGVPVRLDCITWNRYDGGDHVIIIGEVRAIHAAATATHPRTPAHRQPARR